MTFKLFMSFIRFIRYIRVSCEDACADLSFRFSIVLLFFCDSVKLIIIVKYDVIFQPLDFLFCYLLRDDIIIKIDQSNHNVASVGNISTTSRAFQTPYSTLLRPPYWTIEGQYESNSNFDLRNEICAPKNGIYHVSHNGVA